MSFDHKTGYNVKFKTTVLSLTTSCIFALCSANAIAKTANCEIVEQGKTTFKNKCNFQSEKGGSFYISNLNPNKPLMRNTMSVSVTIVEKDFAEVYGSLKGANSSRWGSAKRSGACWVGSDFKVCAR